MTDVGGNRDDGENFTTDNLLVKCTERFVGGTTDTAVLGAGDAERVIFVYGEDPRLIGESPFLGYRLVEFDGRKRSVPVWGALRPVVNSCRWSIENGPELGHSP